MGSPMNAIHTHTGTRAHTHANTHTHTHTHTHSLTHSRTHSHTLTHTHTHTHTLCLNSTLRSPRVQWRVSGALRGCLAGIKAAMAQQQHRHRCAEAAEKKRHDDELQQLNTRLLELQGENRRLDAERQSTQQQLSSLAEACDGVAPAHASANDSSEQVIADASPKVNAAVNIRAVIADIRTKHQVCHEPTSSQMMSCVCQGYTAVCYPVKGLFQLHLAHLFLCWFAFPTNPKYGLTTNVLCRLSWTRFSRRFQSEMKRVQYKIALTQLSWPPCAKHFR